MGKLTACIYWNIYQCNPEKARFKPCAYHMEYNATHIWGVLCQKQLSRARTINYIPQYKWDVITHPCSWPLLLAQHFWFGLMSTFCTLFALIIYRYPNIGDHSQVKHISGIRPETWYEYAFRDTWFLLKIYSTVLRITWCCKCLDICEQELILNKWGGWPFVSRQYFTGILYMKFDPRYDFCVMRISSHAII